MLQDFIPRDLDHISLMGEDLRRLTARGGPPGLCATLSRFPAGIGRTTRSDRSLAARAAPTSPNPGSNDEEEADARIRVVAVAAVAAIIGVFLGFMARRFIAANAVKHAEGYAQRLEAEARAKQKESSSKGRTGPAPASRGRGRGARATRDTPAH
jgi:hypothetical protein